MKTTKKTLFVLGALMVALVCCLDTASAQTLTASPASLTFTTPAGVTPPSQTFTIASSAATTVNLSSFPSWIQFSPTNGPTPLTVTVSIGAGAPVNSSNGSITVTPATGTPISVPVNLNISGTAGVLSASPNPLNFSFSPGAQVAATQTLMILSNNPGITSYIVSKDSNPWLTVADPGNGQLTGATPQGSIMVTVSPAQLPAGQPGPFSGAITLTPPGGGQSTVVPVNVTITSTPALTVTPTSLSFVYQFGTSPQPAAQTLSIGTSTGTSVSFSATTKLGTGCGNGWLIVSQQNSSTPGTLTVSVNTTGLSITTCQGEVDITATGVTNSPLVIPVSLLISASPLLQVPTPGPTFTYQFNSGPSGVPANQNVTITASSNAAVNFSVNVTAAGNGPNFLQVTPVIGTTPQPLTLSLIPLIVQSLGPGTYVENVQLSSSGAGNSPTFFPVTLVVSNTAGLTSSAQSLTFNYQVGQTPPPTQTITINSTAGPLNFTVAPTDISANCPGFLSATVNGGATGLTFGGQNQVAVAVNVTGLTTNQICTGNLAFTVPGSTGTFKVGVILNVSTAPLLNVGVPSINVTALAGSLQTTQMVALTSTSTPLAFTATATTNPAGLTWLSVAPNSGSTPNSLLVSITPGSLGVGSYPGTITVTNTTAGTTQTIPVTLTIVSSNIGTTPAALSFTQPFGAAAPPSQTLQVSGVPAGTTIGVVTTLLNGTGWLTATVSGTNVTVTANGSALSQGTYNGVVTVIVPGAGNSPLNVPVTLVVGAAQSLSLSATTVNFSFQIGAAVPAAQTVQLSSTGAAVPFTATFNGGITSPANLVTIAPASGTTPSPLVLTLNPAVLATLTPGAYSGNVIVSSTAIPGGDQTIKVNLAVATAAPPVIVSVVNGASFAPGPVSPGEIISIFGSNMGPTPGVGFTPVGGKIDVTLAGTQVLFDNVPAPLIFVSGGQINAIVPYEVASLVNTGQGTKVTVVRAGVASSQVVLGLTGTSPAIFSALQTGNGQGAILNTNLSSNSVSNPAPKGSTVSIYATGEGSLTPFVPNGTISGPMLPLPKPIANVSVTIGGQPAIISYAGEAPGLVSGVIQVNAMVPNSINSGPQQVVLTIGTNSNNTQVINVAVQ